MENHNPKVSIITVCLNAEKHIEQAIVSVLEQTYKNIEYIIVDGKSTDGTLEIVGKYKDRIHRIISEEDSGVYDAMNKGLMTATGEVIYFLNSDDRFCDDQVIKDIVTVFDAEPGLDIVYGRLVPVHLAQRLVRGYELSFVGRFQNRRDLLKNCVCHQRLFCRYRLFEENGLFNKSYKICGDVEWLMRALSRRIKLKEIDRDIAFYDCGGMSNRNAGLHNKEKLQIVLRFATLSEAVDYLSFALFRNIFKENRIKQ